MINVGPAALTFSGEQRRKTTEEVDAGGSQNNWRWNMSIAKRPRDQKWPKGESVCVFVINDLESSASARADFSPNGSAVDQWKSDLSPACVLALRWSHRCQSHAPDQHRWTHSRRRAEPISAPTLWCQQHAVQLCIVCCRANADAGLSCTQRRKSYCVTDDWTERSRLS